MIVDDQSRHGGRMDRPS